MSFDFEKEISQITKDIKEEEKQLSKLNSVYNKIPENIINNYSEKIKDSQNNLDNLINTLNIIIKIDKINENMNLQKKLYLLKSLFLTNKISNSYLKLFMVNKLINEEMIKNIEESLLNINYPMFKGKIVMTIYDQLNNENKYDLELLSLYFEIYSYLANSLYKEFPNFGNLTELIKKTNEDDGNNFYFTEMISSFLYKKILATIFYDKSGKNSNIQNDKEMPGYLKKLNTLEKNILYQYEELISYLNKSISNTSELFSILINKASEDNSNNKNKEYVFDKNITLRYIISSLLEKIILFLTSEKTPLDLSGCSNLLIILLIQKTNEQANELIKNYQYDSFKNISLYDYIKYYISDNPNELIKRQKDFNDNIISKLSDNIAKERDSKTYKTEELLDYITMIIKDLLSIYETFRTYKIIEELLMPSCNQILDIFKKYYENETNLGFNKKELSIEDGLFLINLLYNFLTICTTDFNSFLDRINIFGSSTKSKLSDNFTGFNSEVNELFKDYIAFTLNKIRFSKIVRLYDYENLKKGNNVEDIKNIFTEENDFWFKVKSFLNKIKANRKIYKYIETEVVKCFINSLIKKALNNIEKDDIKGKNLDILIDKTKFFIEDNFLTDENVISEENEKDIKKLYSYLDNLFMNKN